jgi:anti-sigma B factor antagonist
MRQFPFHYILDKFPAITLPIADRTILGGGMSSVVKVFQPSGILNGIQGNELRREITDAVQTGVNIVLIDLQDITLMDSSGLGAILAALRTVRASGGKLFLCSIKEQVKMLFEMTRMERLFQTFTNQDEFNQAILSQ